MYEVLKRPDITLYLFARVQGLPDAWVSLGETRNYTSGSGVKAILASNTASISYGTIIPFSGIGESGRLNLELQDTGSYIKNLLKQTTFTYLAQDLAYNETGTMHVDSTTDFGSTGTLYLQRECITYTGKTGTTFTGLTRCANDDYDYRREHLASPGYVKVSTSPGRLVGRWISVWGVALDAGGFPIQDEAGVSKWEIWRGIITSCPPSPDGVNYRLQAETLERLVTTDPPGKDTSGKTFTGGYGERYASAGMSSWGWEAAPIFVQASRAECGVYALAPGAETIAHLPTADDDGYSCFRSLADIAKTLNAQWAYRGISYRFVVESTEDGTQVLKCKITWTVTGTGMHYLTLAGGGKSLWTQLGFLELSHPPMYALDLPGDQTLEFWFTASQSPMQLWLQPSDPDIPVFFDSEVPDYPGFLKIGDEVVWYESIDERQVVGSIPVSVLTGCRRGQGGTAAQEIRQKVDDKDSEGKDVTYAYCPAGADGWAETTVLRAVYKTLLGTNDKGQSESLPVSVVEWPGLGISAEHVDQTNFIPTNGAVMGEYNGVVEDLRQWIDDVLALEGYSLVTRPTASGVKLCLVRVGGISSDSTAATIDASQGVEVQGGLGTVINKVSLEGANKNKVNFYDADSIAELGVTQGKQYSLPVGAGALVSAAPLAARIFALASKGDLLTADVSLAPTSRFVAPGDFIDLTFPNSDLSGTWQVLTAEIPLRGKGAIRCKVQKRLNYDVRQYAPTCTIDSIDSLNNTITLTTGQGQWFSDTPWVRVYDPDEYEDGDDYCILSIDGDTLAFTDITGMSVGDLVEYGGYTDSDSNARYIFLVDDLCSWSD